MSAAADWRCPLAVPRPPCPQVLPNGSRRSRGLPLSEKLLPGERWQEAVVRGVLEELGPVLPADPQVHRVGLIGCMAAGGRLGSCSSGAAARLLSRHLPCLPACQVEVDEGSMEESVETKESQSYPGLLSKVHAAGVLSGPCWPPPAGRRCMWHVDTRAQTARTALPRSTCASA